MHSHFKTERILQGCPQCIVRRADSEPDLEFGNEIALSKETLVINMNKNGSTILRTHRKESNLSLDAGIKHI